MHHPNHQRVVQATTQLALHHISREKNVYANTTWTTNQAVMAKPENAKIYVWFIAEAKVNGDDGIRASTAAYRETCSTIYS